MPQLCDGCHGPVGTYATEHEVGLVNPILLCESCEEQYKDEQDRGRTAYGAYRLVSQAHGTWVVSKPYLPND